MNCYNIRKVELDERGQNKNIKFHIVNEDIMKACGFNFTSDFQIYCETIDEISITIKIPENDKGESDVIDLNFCQPYDFQLMIMKSKNKAPKFAILIQNELYQILDSCKTFGIIDGWEWGDYI